MEQTEQVNKNKSRTAITISPELWQKAKAECERRKEQTGKKVSFSALVEECLEQYLGE